MENKLERKYGLFTAICMVVGIVIGSGVFFKAQDILLKTGGDVKLGVVAWLIGGAIMLACLLTFSFMGQKYERVNGVVDYAEATVGKRYGYLIGWYIAVMYFPAMTSVLSWLSARYTLEFVVSVNPNFPLLIPAAQGGCVVGPECLALALFYTCAVYAMNSIAPKLAGKFQTTTTIIKLIPLATPISSPAMLKSPPPELPELIAALVWSSVITVPSLISTSRSSALMIPSVTVPPSSPKGLPMANTSSPHASAALQPSLATVKVSLGVIFKIAISFSSSVPHKYAS